MRWVRQPYEEGDGHWMECQLGAAGEVYVDSVSGRFVASWFSGGHDIEIARCDTESAAMQASGDWLRMVRTQIDNALAQGCVVVDEE